MASKLKTRDRDVNGVIVSQRERDGFVNGTAMAVAHQKEISDWFRNRETIDLINALVVDLGLEVNPGISQDSNAARISAAYPDLVISRRGAPETGGGTWVHPDLAIQLAQWCSPVFAIQVSRWVRDWLLEIYSPTQIEADIDRVGIRSDLKDVKRLELMDQVKEFLTAAGRYNPKDVQTQIYFGKVHNRLNIVLTTEKAADMRARLERHLGRKVSESQLLRDFFPITDLVNYGTLCQAAANEMIANGTDPLTAIDVAAKQVLAKNYIAKPIDFTEQISLVRQRIAQRDQLKIKGTE
jgi:KilA-N domain